MRLNPDGYLHALDARTGQSLWKLGLAGSIGPVDTCEVDGCQYMAVAAGSTFLLSLCARRSECARCVGFRLGMSVWTKIAWTCSIARHDTKGFPAFDPVDRKIRTIRREHGRAIELFGQRDQRGIRKVHRQIGILVEQLPDPLQ